jgi:hypothetical protein
MAKLLSPALIAEINRVESDHVFTMLFEVNITGAPVPFRLAAYDQDIVFHGLVFTAYPVDVDSLEEANSAALVSLRVTTANVDQQLVSLLENYWANAADPNWQVTIWQVDCGNPDNTPYGVGELYSATQIGTDLRTCTLELQAEGVTLTKTVPGRRYTSSSGFPSVPRRQ